MGKGELMKASDISDAVAAMEMAYDFIVKNVPGSVSGEMRIREKLIRSSIRLSAELSMIPVEIQADK